MKKTNLYRYLGRNGIITSPVFLNNTEKIDMYHLTADKGKILTNGEEFLYSVTIFAEDLNKWVEIEDPDYVEEV